MRYLVGLPEPVNRVIIILIWGTGVYICICNGITDRDIRHCMDGGARTIGDLQRELGVTAGCGQCTHEVKCLLREARDERTLVDRLQPA
jgi:bacterioferritin-associated ferredoxin